MVILTPSRRHRFQGEKDNGDERRLGGAGPRRPRIDEFPSLRLFSLIPNSPHLHFDLGRASASREWAISNADVEDVAGGELVAVWVRLVNKNVPMTHIFIQSLYPQPATIYSSISPASTASP